jgi:hypothetical protein
MTTNIAIPLEYVLEYKNMEDCVREVASESLGVSLGNGDGEYPWTIDDFWRAVVGKKPCVVFNIYAESDDPEKKSDIHVEGYVAD